MNQTTIEPLTQTVQSIADNPWIILVTTIGVILVLYLDLGSRLFSYINRPKIEFKTKIDRNPDSELGAEWEKYTFWAYVDNKGKSLAPRCQAKLRMTDPTGKVDVGHRMSIPFKDGIFPIKWHVSDELKDSIDIFAVENDTGVLKIPLNVHIPKQQRTTDKDMGRFTYDPPIKQLTRVGMTIERDNSYEIYIIKIKLFVNLPTGTFTKNFIIEIPIDLSLNRIEKGNIKFYENSD